ncbi:hypothetical protein DFS34DRAFT_594943 [Phlyctochytrium arcticum]|nr:hypothetical protein DFS34DRAFT_594943 [Phlyctochytrium arcticum]
MISSSHLDLIENVLEDQHYSSALNLIYALSGCSQSQSKSFAGHLLDTLNTGSTLLPEAAAVLRLLIQSNNLVSLQELLQYQKDASPERSSVWKLILNSWTVWETSLTEDSSNESGSMFSGRGIHKMLVERIEREISECEDVKQCSLMGKGQRLSRKQLATNFQSLLSSMLEADVADPEVIPTAAKWIYQVRSNVAITTKRFSDIGKSITESVN